MLTNSNSLHVGVVCIAHSLAAIALASGVAWCAVPRPIPIQITLCVRRIDEQSHQDESTEITNDLYVDVCDESGEVDS